MIKDINGDMTFNDDEKADIMLAAFGVMSNKYSSIYKALSALAGPHFPPVMEDAVLDLITVLEETIDIELSAVYSEIDMYDIWKPGQ